MARLPETSFHIDGNSVSFWVQVKPRSSRQGLELASPGELYLRIHAAPTEGQANEACVQFLARHLRLPQNSVSILAGRARLSSDFRRLWPLGQKKKAQNRKPVEREAASGDD